jgi:HD domain
MIIQTNIPLIENLLQNYIGYIGKDFAAYQNHCYRVFNFCSTFTSEKDADKDKIAIAAVFHDLGIWTNNTFDYLKPSQDLAKEYLNSINKFELIDEVVSMISNHHKIRKYHSSDIVESFRKADWTDITLGHLKFGLPKSFVQETFLTFPNAGFHKRITVLTINWTLKHPLNPLPMMKL